jgi:hypothetical protein
MTLGTMVAKKQQAAEFLGNFRPQQRQVLQSA